MTLPIEDNFFDVQDKIVGVVMINYFANNSLGKTLKAEQMVTLSLFQSIRWFENSKNFKENNTPYL